MLDIDNWYSEKWHELTSPSFEEVIKCCNEWLCANKYAPITTQAAIEHLKDHDVIIYPYPYNSILDYIEKAVKGGKDGFKDFTKTFFNTIDYVPVDHGYKSGENGENFRLSKIDFAPDAPNDYGMSERQIKELFK